MADAVAVAKPDWQSLAKDLNVGSGEEAEQRAFAIARFVAHVEKDSDKTLVLKTGGKYIELALNKNS